jgi:hypothetical protein
MSKHRDARLFTLATIFNLAGNAIGRWDEVRTEKSDLPKREPMNLTEEETATLESLTGKAKKSYIKELKAKYESN